MKAKLTPRAVGQIRKATTWLDANRGPDAGDALVEDIQQTVHLLLRHPQIGAPVKNARAKDARRLYLPAFSYHLYYRVRRDVIEVLAIRHTSRGRVPGI